MQTFEFNSKIYHKKINRRTISHPIIAVILIIILLTLSLCFIKAFPKSNTVDYYFVSADCLQAYSQAEKLSRKVADSGGAGYCLYDKKYYILVSVYLDEQSANNVKDIISDDYPNAQIYKLSINKYTDYPAITSQSLSTIYKLLKCYTNYSMNNISYDQLLIGLIQIKDEYYKEYESFIDEHKSNSRLNPIKEHLSNINDSLNTLTTVEEHGISQALLYHTSSIILDLYYASV